MGSNKMATQEEIKVHLDKINTYLMEADASFRMYCYFLKMRRKNRIKFYNYNLYTFHYLINALLNNFLSQMAKLIDPAEQGRGGMLKNSNLNYLKDILDEEATPEEKNKMKQLTDYIKSNSENLKLIRDKELSHSDRETVRHDVIKKENRKSIRKLLNAKMKLLNVFRSINNRVDNQRYFFEWNIDKQIKQIFQPMIKDYKDA